MQATKEYERNGGVAPLVLVLDATGRTNARLHSPSALIPVTKLMRRVYRGGDEGASNKELGNTTENNINCV